MAHVSSFMAGKYPLRIDARKCSDGTWVFSLSKLGGDLIDLFDLTDADLKAIADKINEALAKATAEALAVEEAKSVEGVA